MATTVWRGQLTFGLVSFPVRLHIAARKERVRMHYLRRTPSKAEPVNEQTPMDEQTEEEAAEPDKRSNGPMDRRVTEVPSEAEALRFPVTRIKQEFLSENDERPVARLTGEAAV